MRKVRSVGYMCYDEEADFYELEINGLEKSSHILMPEKDIHCSHDYVIYHESLEKKDLEPMGVGYLLHKSNAGLIQLEWDFYDSSNIYINLHSARLMKQKRVA